MFAESIETSTSTERHTEKITDPNAIWRMLEELVECKDLVFFTGIGANLAFFANVVAVNAQYRIFQVEVITATESRANIHLGNAFDVVVPIRDADLLFKTSLVNAVPEQINTYNLSMPSTVRLWRRREHPRGQCFGLVEIIMSRKDKPQGKAMRATLCDISHGGLGISLPAGMNPSVQAGDAFGDCSLLLNGKPIAMCAIEVLHTRQGPKTGNLIAGARFVKPDDVTKQRIAKLITAFKPIADEPMQGAVDCA